MKEKKLDLSRLNKEQLEAVTTTEGPLLVIAGPGTGKTSVLVKRVLYLITEKGAKAGDIFVATFTNKAAKEIRTRISNELIALGLTSEVNLNDMYIGTFHSIFMDIIGEYVEETRLKKNYVQIDDFEQREIISKNIKLFQGVKHYSALSEDAWTRKKKGFSEDLSRADLCKEIANIVNTAREELSNLEALKQDKDDRNKCIAELTEVYLSIIEKENVIDFSGIMAEAYELLKNHTEITQELSEKIKYIMVDEYQDTNYVQEQLILLLGGTRNNICVVGDDDQGLYRFRGATIGNIFNFPENFDSGKSLVLKTNYRSSAQIVETYSTWMRDDFKDVRDAGFKWKSARYKKNITCFKKETLGKTSVVKCLEDSDEKWYESVYQIIIDLKKKGIVTDNNQIAFLCSSPKRYGELAYTGLIDYLEERGLPVYAPRFGMFEKREEIRSIIGCLLYCFPNSFVKESYYENERQLAEKLMRENKELGDWIKAKEKVHTNLAKTTSYSLSDLVYQLFAFEPFRSFLNVGRGLKNERTARNLAKFVELVSRYEISNNMQKGLVPKYYEKNVKYFFTYYLPNRFADGITEYEDDSEYAPKGCISFMTIHQSKGMEFPVVFVDSLDSVPYDAEKKWHKVYAKTLNRREIEDPSYVAYYDFWRLFYTAFSRPQNLLILTEATNRRKRNSFLFSELCNMTLDYKEADLSHINPQEVKNVELKECYSFTSHLALYETCSQKYNFYKRLGFIPNNTSNTLFGTLVHETIEDIHKAAIAGDEKKITEKNIQKWMDINYETLSNAEHSYLNIKDRETAFNQVMNYVKNNKKEWKNIKETEVDISVIRDKYILNGKVDLVKGDEDSFELVDFKTGQMPNPGDNSVMLNHYKEQLITYAYMISERTGKRISKAHLYYTSVTEGNPKISIDITSGKIDETLDKFDSIITDIQNGVFEKCAEDKLTCKMCDMRYYCHNNMGTPAYSMDLEGFTQNKKQDSPVYYYKYKNPVSDKKRLFYHTDSNCKYLYGSKLQFENVEAAQKAGYVNVCLECQKKQSAEKKL